MAAIKGTNNVLQNSSASTGMHDAKCEECDFDSMKNSKYFYRTDSLILGGLDLIHEWSSIPNISIVFLFQSNKKIFLKFWWYIISYIITICILYKLICLCGKVKKSDKIYLYYMNTHCWILWADKINKSSENVKREFLFSKSTRPN